MIELDSYLEYKPKFVLRNYDLLRLTLIELLGLKMSSLKEKRAEKKLLKIIKYDANANVALGLKYIPEEDYDSAIMCFTQAIKLNSNFFEAYNNRGVCYLKLKKNDLALADFDKAIKIKPSHPDAYINRINCYQAQENQEMALADYNKVIELKPNDAESYKLRGFVYTIQKKYELALSDFNKSEQLDYQVKDVAFYSGRSLCYSKLKINELALEDFNKAIELDSKCFQNYVNRGIHYLELESYELALKDFNKAIILDENDPSCYINRGLCYSKLINDNLYKLALTDYNKTIQLNPNIFETYYNIALCYLELDEHEKSLEYFNKSIELNPNDYDNYHDRGLCYFKLENYNLALIDFKKTIELKNSYVETYVDIGNCYYGLKEYDHALENYNKSIQLNPNCAKSYNNRGLHYAEQKNYDLAINDLTKAIEFFESKEHKKNCCLSISNVLISVRKYDDARKYVEQAFNYAGCEDQHKDIYLSNIANTEELDKKNQELEKLNDTLKSQIEETKKANKIAHEKEKEMLSFFTHTMRNALATAPESLRQAIRLLGSEDYEKNKKQYKAINKIAALFSTLSLTDCLIDTFKQSINDPQEFKLAWQNDNTGDATPKWVIASALRQSLNRIIFMSDASQLEKLLNITETASIVSMRKSFIETVLPLNVDNHGINTFYDWLNGINSIEIAIEEKNFSNFGVNQVKFSLLFAITSELILNSLKYWNGIGHIEISWQLIEENFVFTVKNPCHANASSNLAGTHKGIAFINRLMELLGDQAHFNCIPDEQHFTAQLTLHKSLLGNNS